MKLTKCMTLLSVFVSIGVQAESRWGVGIARIVSDKGYEGIDSDNQLVPAIYYESDNFYLLGPEFGSQLISRANWEFSLVGQYRVDGYDEDDSDIFIGMEDRSDSIDLGLEVEYETEVGDFSLKALTDVTNEHKGYEIKLTYSSSFSVKSGMISPFVTVTQASKDLVDYYYGVRAEEATNIRSTYLGQSTNNIEVGIRTAWQYGKHHQFISNFSYTSFGSEIENSPLIDSSGGASLLIGYVYVF